MHQAAWQGTLLSLMQDPVFPGHNTDSALHDCRHATQTWVQWLLMHSAAKAWSAAMLTALCRPTH